MDFKTNDNQIMQGEGADFLKKFVASFTFDALGAPTITKPAVFKEAVKLEKGIATNGVNGLGELGSIVMSSPAGLLTLVGNGDVYGLSLKLFGDSGGFGFGGVKNNDSAIPVNTPMFQKENAELANCITPEHRVLCKIVGGAFFFLIPTVVGNVVTLSNSLEIPAGSETYVVSIVKLLE